MCMHSQKEKQAMKGFLLIFLLSYFSFASVLLSCSKTFLRLSFPSTQHYPLYLHFLKLTLCINLRCSTPLRKTLIADHYLHINYFHLGPVGPGGWCFMIWPLSLPIYNRKSGQLKGFNNRGSNLSVQFADTLSDQEWIIKPYRLPY